jgi:acetoin utilization deacetylase AcuC-like enzyme
MINVGLPSRAAARAFREAVTRRWMPALEAFRPS